MKNKYFLIVMFLTAFIFCGQAVNAQITITIPKIPKFKKTKVETTSEPEITNDNSQNNQGSAPTQQKEKEEKY